MRSLFERFTMKPALPRVVVVTGASGAIGAALAEAYAAPGMCLALQGRHTKRLDATVMSCRSKGAEVHVCEMDVRATQPLRDWLVAFDTQHPVDLLIADAGLANVLGDLSQWETPTAVDEVISTNLFGTINTVLPIAERMRERGGGHIAIVSSLAALRGMAISPAYCASKSALHGWGQSIRPLLRAKGISLTMIYPGFVKSKMSDAFPASTPFLMEAPRAAEHIRSGLDARRTTIAFPAILWLGLKLLNVLPDPWGDAVLAFLNLSPKKDS
jgi:short-subunit dehydrogenase